MAFPFDAIRDAAATVGRVARRSLSAALRLDASTPFSGAPQPAPATPPIDWNREGPAPVPYGGAPFVPGYSDHTYRPMAAPIAFDGFTLDRLRMAASLHRQGLFLESSLAAVSILSFGPCLAALEQRMAPAISLDRHISAEGARGLARVVASEVEEMICPRDGLISSPFFPSELFGAIELCLALFRFAVLQHVDGDPDPETGIRPRYTRLWPIWATQYYRYNKKWIALTTEGPVEIDGVHFTLVADVDEPHLTSAILALMEEAFSGRQTEQFRNAWIRAFGSPKLVGVLPPSVPTDSDMGRMFYQAVQTILGPGGFGLLPNESDMKTIGLSGEASGSFKEALDSVIGIIGMVLLGSSGLLDKGTGGVYTSPVYEGVALRLISRDITARDRAINSGHILPFCRLNYGAQIDALKRGSGGSRWIDPVLRTPLPDLAAQQRYENNAKNQAAYYAALKAETEAKGIITQERADALAARHGATPLLLPVRTTTGAESTPADLTNGVVTINDRLAELGKPPDTTGRGAMTWPEFQAFCTARVEQKKAEAQAEAKVETAPAQGAEQAAA